MRNSLYSGLWVVLVPSALIYGGCGPKKPPPPAQTTPVAQTPPPKPPAKPPAKAALKPPPKPPAPAPRESHFASAGTYDELARADAAVKPSIKPYTIRPRLANVVNLKVFKGAILPAQVRMVAKNGFVVSPTGYTQMFQVYENNEYQPVPYPSFITTDSMLHTYHVFYDYSLRTVESTRLFDAAVKLTDAMLSASQSDLAAAKAPVVRDAARRNAAYFAVARNLLIGTPAPRSLRKLAAPDLASIRKHDGRAVSSLLGYKIDFSQFIPRGHYTRSEKLKRYFLAMMWYGLCPLPIPQPGSPWGARPTVQSLLIVRGLQTARAGGAPAMKLWETIYEPTAFYVGTADDYTVYNYSAVAERVYGKRPGIDRFADAGLMGKFTAGVKALPGPGIENFVAVSRSNSSPDPLFPVGRQFRFMGQRFIPDSRIMQELTHPKVDGRNFPKGLDVMAALGSDRALAILDKTYHVNAFTGYQAQMSKMRHEMSATPRQTWQSNLYYGWLWSLQALIKPAGAGYPSFMRGTAWQDKTLFTALGSWTELRHDTILYSKPTVTECGGDGAEKPKPKGYVEPNLEFWTRLKWLNDFTKAGLGSRGLLTASLKDKFANVGDWIDFCRKITIKELTNQKVTDEEYQQMEYYGPGLERIYLDTFEGQTLSDTDKDMALVADVHTSFDKAMEEGTGRAAEILVVVPIGGKLYLTRGAVYTQYEFEHPASNRLTDEQWQKMLRSGREPGFAEWVKTFLLPVKRKSAPEFENYAGGC